MQKERGARASVPLDWYRRILLPIYALAVAASDFGASTGLE